MRKIYLTESQFKKFLNEKISEISSDKLNDAGDAIEYGRYNHEDREFPRPGLLEIEEALETLQNALEHHYRDSKQIRIFMNYVSEMMQFFDRKKTQAKTFYNAAENKEAEYQQYLINLAREQFGFNGNDLKELSKEIGEKDSVASYNGDDSEPNWNNFLNSIADPDIRNYAENNI